MKKMDKLFCIVLAGIAMAASVYAEDKAKATPKNEVKKAEEFPTEPFPTEPFPTEPFPTEPFPTEPYMNSRRSHT